MTHYISRPHFDPSFEFPALIKDCRTTALMLRVEHADGLRTFLGRWINRTGYSSTHGQLEFTPLPGAPVLLLINEGRLGVMAAGGDWDKPGWARYREIAFALPVKVEQKATAPVTTSAHGPRPPIVWLLPYIFADIHPAVATGREAWGYEKVSGDISIGSDLFGHTNASARTLAWWKLDPSAEGKPSTVVRARRTGFGFSALGTRSLGSRRVVPRVPPAVRKSMNARSCGGIMDDWVDEDVATRWIMERLPGLPVGYQLPIVNLKQMRRTDDATQAETQSLVLSHFEIRPGLKLTRLWLPGSWEVEIPALQSAPIASDLGLIKGTPSSPTMPRVLGGVTLRYDVELPAGQVIWSP